MDDVGLHISQDQIDRARKAFQGYIAWAYAHPKATANELLVAQWNCAKECGLSTEGKVYYSVMVNESQGGVVSRPTDPRKAY